MINDFLYFSDTFPIIFSYLLWKQLKMVSNEVSEKSLLLEKSLVF